MTSFHQLCTNVSRSEINDICPISPAVSYQQRRLLQPMEVTIRLSCRMSCRRKIQSPQEIRMAPADRFAIETTYICTSRLHKRAYQAGERPRVSMVSGLDCREQAGSLGCTVSSRLCVRNASVQIVASYSKAFEPSQKQALRDKYLRSDCWSALWEFQSLIWSQAMCVHSDRLRLWRDDVSLVCHTSCGRSSRLCIP